MAEEKKVVEPTFIIKLSKNGDINISGPLPNEMLCLYLLEKAKDLVKGYTQSLKRKAFEDSKSKIIKPGAPGPAKS